MVHVKLAKPAPSISVGHRPRDLDVAATIETWAAGVAFERTITKR